MDIQVVPFDPKTASHEEWRRFHVYRRAHQMETDPEDPVFDDETIERMERHSNVQWDWRRLVVLDRDRPDVTIGEVTLEFSRPGTPDPRAERAHRTRVDRAPETVSSTGRRQSSPPEGR